MVMSATVWGGWGAVDNVIQNVGQSAGPSISGFFPSPQRTEPIRTEIMQAAGGGFLGYRPTAPSAQSIAETNRYSLQGWMGSPYEANFSTEAKVKEGRTFAKNIGAAGEAVGRTLADVMAGMRAGTEYVAEVRTVADDFMTMLGMEPRETIVGTPRAGYPEGRDEAHLNALKSKAAAVVQAAKNVSGQLLGQMKGLFNIGFDPSGSQPVFAIRHDIPEAPKLIGIVVAGIVAIFLLRGSK